MSVIDSPRVVLALAGRWPRHGTSDALSGIQRRLCEADRIRACLACGGPVAVPDDRIAATATSRPTCRPGTATCPTTFRTSNAGSASAGWEIHPNCAAGLDQWGAAWPAIAVAGELDRPSRLVRPLDGRLAAEVAAACRPCVDCPPTEREPRLQVPLFVDEHGTDPRHPTVPWSFTDAAARGAGAWLWRDPRTGREVEADALPTPPTMRDVVAAELADARLRLHWSEAVPPAAALTTSTPACWWCGRGRAPRSSWTLIDSGAGAQRWCELADSCPQPIVGNSELNQVTALGHLLDRPAEMAWLRLAALPIVTWGMLPDDQRVPAGEPFAWLDDGQLAEFGARLDRLVDEDQHLNERFLAAEADRRAADAAQAARDAELAEIRDVARQAARAEASKVAVRRNRIMTRSSTRSALRARRTIGRRRRRRISRRP
jgi:hypothetical protein